MAPPTRVAVACCCALLTLLIIAWVAHNKSAAATKRYNGLEYVEVNVEAYYQDAERHMKKQWRQLIWPRIKRANFSSVVEIAAGWGRNTARLLPLASKLIAADINPSAISHMRQRFARNKLAQQGLATFHLTNGTGLPMVADGSATLVYSWDAMVHFEARVIAAYVEEVARVLAPNGTAFLHHSRLPRCSEAVLRSTGPHGEPDACGAAGDGSIVRNPESRSVVGPDERSSDGATALATMKELVADRAAKFGLEVRQHDIPWHLVRRKGYRGAVVYDCISLLRKPPRVDGARARERQRRR